MDLYIQRSIQQGRNLLQSRCRRYRYFASDASVQEKKSYSHTLLLPRTSFPLWRDPAKDEGEFQSLTCDELYKWQLKNAKGPLFVLLDGPPYANGNLHMGHALNKILKDIINRFHVSLGRKVHYHPGWDCHGLPIENKALQELGIDSSTSSSTIIRSSARATALREVESQKSQFKALGIMADWNNPQATYRTLDHDYEMRQLRLFQRMVEQNMIYRHYRPVYYSPSSRSALAEAELVYENHVSHSVYVNFELDQTCPSSNKILQQIQYATSTVQLLVWTTTPWTLTANMGIAVNPYIDYSVIRSENPYSNKIKDVTIVAKSRLDDLIDIIGPFQTIGTVKGSDLVGASYTPIFSGLHAEDKPVPMKIIAASHVAADSGTGLVHCAPAHGTEDYQAFRNLGLLTRMEDILCHVDSAGKFTDDVSSIVGNDVAANLVGQDVLRQGSKSIVDVLRSLGNLVEIKRINHRYPYDWRTKEPIIITSTSQWFANLDKIKDKALTALDDVEFYPPNSQNRLRAFVHSRSEWCISRQRVWGVPIPALHHKASDRVVLDALSLDYILGVLQEKGVSHWWDGPVDDFVPRHLMEDGKSALEIWTKGTDTMDVWFDSGTSWSTLDNAITKRAGKPLADLCLEGSDQHRGWFQSQLLTAVGVADVNDPPSSPYGALLTHGMVLDESGKKMSKSLGNIVSPMSVLIGGKDKTKEPAYGPDVLRLWTANVEYWRDMSIGPRVLAQTAKSLKKVRNSARFCLGNIGNSWHAHRVPREELGLVERYVMHELYTLERVALDGYSTFNFSKVMNALNNFTTVTLSSFYFDITKDCLYANSIGSWERRAVVTVLEHVLGTLTSVIAPVLPHLAEEIYASWKQDGKSVFMTPWIPLTPEWQDDTAAAEMKTLLLLRSNVHSLLEEARSQKRIKSSLEAEIDIILPPLCSKANSLVNLIMREEKILKNLFIVSDVSLIHGVSSEKYTPWAHLLVLPWPDSQDEFVLRVRPAVPLKCPRCWTFTRSRDDDLCGRCYAVILPQSQFDVGTTSGQNTVPRV